MEGDLNWGGKHTIQYTDDVTELYTWKLYNFINQCHPNKFFLFGEKKSRVCHGMY